MNKIPKNIVVYGALGVVCIVLVVVGAVIYGIYGNTLLQQNATRVMRTPENFVGGLTEVHEGAGALQPTQIVELKDGDTFDLTATIVTQEVGNKLIKRLAYNGQIPGPVLKVQKGAKITVNFTNNIDMETTLHSHGVRGDWHFDGMAPVSQEPIPVGGTFTYELEFPDAGVYWYHPHIREDYQQGLGLYGNFIVSEDGYWNDVDHEEYLIFDDFLEDADFDPDIITHTLMGRYGNSIRINDAEDYQIHVKQGEITRLFMTDVANTRTFDLSFPSAGLKQVGGDNGRVEKEEMITNTIIAPSERSVVELYYKDAGTFDILNHGQKIGEVVVEKSDASELSAFQQLRSNAADYAFIRDNFNTFWKQTPDKQLRLDIALKDLSSEKDSGADVVDSEGNVTLMGVKMTKEQGIEHCKVMPQMSECNALLATDGPASVTLDGVQMTVAQAQQHCQLQPSTAGCDAFKIEGMSAPQMHSHIDGIEWEDGMVEINELSTNQTVEWIIEDQETGNRNSEINWSFHKGDLVKVRVFNDGKGLHPMQHPIHFHGQRFVVLGRDGLANENLQWKDTVLIPMGQTVDLLVDMSNPGEWMAHCHIAEHLHAGMMFHFKVEDN